MRYEAEEVKTEAGIEAEETEACTQLSQIKLKAGLQHLLQVNTCSNTYTPCLCLCVCGSSMRSPAELQFTALKMTVYNIHINARVLTHTHTDIQLE